MVVTQACMKITVLRDYCSLEVLIQDKSKTKQDEE
jgi:hypothetical protein